jgi:hypothetical protein
LPHAQQGQQENQLDEVKQVPPKLMKKLQTGLKAVLQEKEEMQGQAG